MTSTHKAMKAANADEVRMVLTMVVNFDIAGPLPALRRSLAASPCYPAAKSRSVHQRSVVLRDHGSLRVGPDWDHRVVTLTPNGPV